MLETLARLDVPRLTLDVDGTIVRTGATVAWAFRGLCRIERMARVACPYGDGTASKKITDYFVDDVSHD